MEPLYWAVNNCGPLSDPRTVVDPSLKNKAINSIILVLFIALFLKHWLFSPTVQKTEVSKMVGTITNILQEKIMQMFIFFNAQYSILLLAVDHQKSFNGPQEGGKRLRTTILENWRIICYQSLIMLFSCMDKPLEKHTIFKWLGTPIL